MVAVQEYLDLAQAADELDVHYQTAYRWVREGRLPAERVGRRYRIRALDLDAARAEPVPVEVHEQPSQRRWDRTTSSLRAALLAGDERRCDEIVMRLRAQGESVRSLIGNLIAPAMGAIGRGWVDGEVTIAQEHRATAIVERLLVSLDRPRPGRPRGSVAVAAVSGDQHGLPVAMAAAALREDGWNVEILGRDVPPETLIEHAVADGIDLVVLSQTNPDVADVVAGLAADLEARGVRVLLGGPGASLDALVEHARRR